MQNKMLSQLLKPIWFQYFLLQIWLINLPKIKKISEFSQIIHSWIEIDDALILLSLFLNANINCILSYEMFTFPQTAETQNRIHTQLRQD